ncbi:hypothetical protein F1847_05980 [Thermodesulfobacterium sp. TA1]|uniref:DUF6178 family protein n=1 Tax=Thermodesulfobacterium sp. TA1 TaxID=2234087 RepID=UPI0012326630|nr:DUF6178 family protein [Thermodesulfobacterium sp. TA1]QER42312.1 hypothetical protein F1847_05980 [Thermodesulfobacterium sp. TA1]
MKTLFKKTFEGLSLDLKEILKLSEKELEKRLQALDFYQAYDLVLNAPWEDKAKLILNSPYPEGLVKNLPYQELFLTIKASSLDLSVELLSYAKGSQIQFMFDMDCWYKDRIKKERVASWIVLLFHAGEGKVLEWLKVADFDFLIAMFQKFIKVYKKPDDIELIEAMDFLPYFTLDDFYFIEFQNEALEFYFRRMIEILREEMAETYFALLESVIWEIPAEVEERAYRWRNGRLADEGILEYFEALDVYTILHPKSLRKIEPIALPSSEEKEEFSPINIMVYPGEEELLIFKVVEAINDPYQIGRIKKELAWLANKVIIVDNVVIDEIEQVKKSLDKLWGSLNLGIEYLSQGNREVAKSLVEEHFLEDLFRVAQTLLKQLRKFALSVTKSKDFDPSVLRYLDQPYKGYLEGVLVKKINEIRYFRPEKIGTLEEYTFFKKISEVNTARRYIEEIGYIAPVMERMFGSTLSWIKEVNQPGRNYDVNFLTWSGLILTSFFHWKLNGEFIFKAIPKSSWAKVLNELFEEKEDHCELKPEMKETFFKSFENYVKTNWYYEGELLNSFLNFVIEKLSLEFRNIDLKNPPDPKYQTLILIDLNH